MSARPKATLRVLQFDPSDKFDPPQPRSNFITNDGRVIVGPFPPTEGEGSISDLYDYGVTHIANLTETPDYKVDIPEDLIIYDLPIKNGGVPSQSAGLDLVDTLLDIYKNEPDSIIYIHCMGGHGRAGTIGALFIGKLEHLYADEAIEWIEEAHDSREDKSRNFIPTPESQMQVNYLVKLLGLSKNGTVPDRSDRRWLQRVKAERRGRK